MTIRKILSVVLGLVLAAICLSIMFPRFGNDFSCDSDVPSSTAQQIALDDARARTAPVCKASNKRCQCAVSTDLDGTLKVSLYFVQHDFFEGCVWHGQHSEVLVYRQDGLFVGTEEAPYGLYSAA